MIASTLCRERLYRILDVLEKHGALTVRDFTRTFSVWEWEIEQAAALGWVKIETRKPRTGRPSRVVRTVSNCQAAKLPLHRRCIEKPISIRHANFALHSVCRCVKGGAAFIGMLPLTDAYRRAFPASRKRRAATASMSRLLRRPEVKAARAWYYALANREIPLSECMPDTASGIWQRLKELGNWRAGPRITVVRQ